MIIINDKKIELEKFPNNEIRIRKLNSLKEKKILVEFKYESSDDLMGLYFIKNKLENMGVKAELYIRYMPYSRMDREFDNDLFLLKYIAKFINDLKFEKVYILEPHSNVTEDLIDNVISIYPMVDLIKDVKRKIKFDECNDMIVFPDAGSYKRYGHDFKNYILFDKKRDSDSTKIKKLSIKEGKINKNSKCIIIDDLCASGGTCYKVGNILKENGVKEVYVLTVHTENQALNNLILKDDKIIDKIYTTSSLLTDKHRKIELLDFNHNKYVI